MKAGMRMAVAALVVAATAAAVVPAPGSSDGSEAVAKRGKCKLTRDFALGTFASYINEYSARNVGCRKARKVIAAYHDCRKENGGRNGRCAKAAGYKCKEDRGDSVPGVQYSASVVCKRGDKKVKHHYTMNL